MNGSVQCHLHLHLHGCTQTREWIGDGYVRLASILKGVFPKVSMTKFGNSVRESGFIPLAARNNIVVVFPQIKANFYNAGGCWNAFGYLPADSAGSQYATKQGKQMRAVARMVEKIANVSMF